MAIDPEHPNPDADWLDDPAVFEIAYRTIVKLLDGVRPPGPVPELSVFAEFGTINNPAMLWLGIQGADSSLPLGVSQRQHLANVIKADLGNIADRPKIVIGSADDFRRAAAEMEGGATPPTTKRRKKGKSK